MKRIKKERSREDAGDTKGHGGCGDKSTAVELIGSRWRYLYLGVWMQEERFISLYENRVCRWLVG